MKQPKKKNTAENMQNKKWPYFSVSSVSYHPANSMSDFILILTQPDCGPPLSKKVIIIQIEYTHTHTHIPFYWILKCHIVQIVISQAEENCNNNIRIWSKHPKTYEWQILPWVVCTVLIQHLLPHNLPDKGQEKKLTLKIYSCAFWLWKEEKRRLFTRGGGKKIKL